MGGYVKATIANCVDCLRNQALFRQEVPLKPLPLPDGVFERVSVDTMGPFPTSRNGNKYIYLAVCGRSKFPVAMAVPQLSAKDFTSFFLLHVVAQHGVPAVCLSDNGPEFSTHFSATLRELGIQHRRSSAGHAQANGQAEAMVKQITYALQKMVNEGNAPETWCEKLPMTLLGLRTAPNSGTRLSPAFVVYGRDLCLPAQRRRQLLAAPEDREERLEAAAGGASIERRRRLVLDSSSEDLADLNLQAGQRQPNSQDKRDQLGRPKRKAADGAAAAAAAAAAALFDQEDDPDWQQTTPPIKSKKRTPAKTPTTHDDSAINLVSPEPSPIQDLPPGTEQLLLRRAKHRAHLNQQLEHNVKKSQAKMRRDHARRRALSKPSTTMPVGSLVWMKKPAGNKLTADVEGPYRVYEYNNTSSAGPSAAAAAEPEGVETRARLQDNKGSLWWVNVGRICPYEAPN